MGKPIYLKVEKTIDQPLEMVWETVALGFGNVSDYNPEVKDSRLVSDRRSGIGTRRHCDFPKKGYIVEEITEWVDKDSFKVKFIESSIPMGFLESKFSFQSREGQTLVIQEFWYRMKAPFGWMSRLMKGKMKSTLESGLLGLENHLKRN
ncbi:SRPBCC family protein [Gracilimonas sp.]|uniref:SRPBCC family protein n=1 Tax=Gracilimonas sp. TaxID=1974203 RepID=UPI003D0B3888